MAITELEQIMNFVRIDGRDSAPIRFLTIEDGGGLYPDEFATYITGESNWIPSSKARPLNYKKTGAPGEFISKIMTFAFGDFCATNDWREYRAQHLYSFNESNIKYYPIGRKKTSSWPEWLSSRLSITAAEYTIQCLAERPLILAEKYKSFFASDVLYILLGARDEWSYFLRKYVFPEDRPGTVDDHGGFHFVHSSRPPEALLFAYYPMFSRGNKSTEKLKRFASNLRRKAPDEILKKLSHNAIEISVNRNSP